MTNEEYLNKIREHGAELRKDPVKLLEFMKSIGAFKKRRIIEGEEREQVLTMLRLLGPGEQTNNQHIWTESWRVGNIEYNIHTGEKFDELEEVIDDEPAH
jgi:hypothetical protein